MNNYEKLNLYPHNINTCNKIKSAFDSGKDIVSIIKATGTGKSYIGLNLALEHKNEKIIWLVPTNAIKEHIIKTIDSNPNLSMEDDFHNLEIKTYSSLTYMEDEELETLQCDLLIVDELHHIGAPVWGEKVNYLIDTHKNMKTFGMSAYSVRDRGTAYERDMTNPETEEIFSNTVIDRYDLYDAIIDGVLPLPLTKSILTENSSLIEYLKSIKKLKKIKDKPIYYQIDEFIDTLVKTIHNQELTKEIIQESVKENGKYIYFCPIVSHSGINDIDSIIKTISGYIQEKYPNKKIVIYKTTSDMGEYGKYNRDCFYNNLDLDGKDASDTIRIMFAKNQYNEGVHAPNVDGVFLGRETTSDIVALEQIGRALSVSENIEDKRKEYSSLQIDELKEIALSRGITFQENITKEYLIELLISPIIIDLADNIYFLEELENNLKDRIKQRKKQLSTNSDNRKRLEFLEEFSPFMLETKQKDLILSLINLKNQVSTHTWEDNYELVKTFYNHYGHTEILMTFKTIDGIQYDETGINLGKWCGMQREKFREGRLESDKIKKLELLNFRFDIKNTELAWQETYKLLKKYYKKYNNSEVPHHFKTINGHDYDENGINLGSWCTAQRQKNRLGKLTKERTKKLELLNFRFETNKYEITWEKMYILLKKYYKKYNNSEVPHNFNTFNGYDYDENGDHLAIWCHHQRQSFKNGTLEPEKIKKLELLNFRFETNKKELMWNKMYNLLEKYYKRYRNSEVPDHFKTQDGIIEDKNGFNLGIWCYHQRQSFKNGTLEPEKIKKLELLNFRFETKNKELVWQEMYELLETYYKDHGNSEVSYNFKTSNGYDYDQNGANLGMWCVKQKQKFKLGKLAPERIQKLELLGFRFTSNKENKEKKLELCNSYGIEYSKHKILKLTSYQELYAKIIFLIDHNYPIETNDKLHEIFYMSNENMILKYMISKEDLIMKYYIERKGKNK